MADFGYDFEQGVEKRKATGIVVHFRMKMGPIPLA